LDFLAGRLHQQAALQTQERKNPRKSAFIREIRVRFFYGRL
jgi:hypothetical protein